MLILGLILFGMLIGALAQLILGKSRAGIDWSMAIIAGLVGSFVGCSPASCPATASSCAPAASSAPSSAPSS